MRDEYPDCIWTYSDDEDCWGSTCAHKFVFFDEGPDENGFAFCPFCGRPIDIIKNEYEGEEAQDDQD